VFRDPRDNDSLRSLGSSSSTFIPFVISLLTRSLADEPIAPGNTSRALSKLERSLFAAFRPTIDAANLWSDDITAPARVTPRRLGLSILNSISISRPMFLPFIGTHVGILLNLLQSMLGPPPSGDMRPKKGVVATEAPRDFAEVEALIDILELCTPPTSSPSNVSYEAALPGLLATFLVTCFREACSADVQQASAGKHSRPL
jgi:hypothetical protein